MVCIMMTPSGWSSPDKNVAILQSFGIGNRPVEARQRMPCKIFPPLPTAHQSMKGAWLPPNVIAVRFALVPLTIGLHASPFQCTIVPPDPTAKTSVFPIGSDT